MFDKKMFSWILIGLAVIFGLIVFKSVMPWLFMAVAILGWCILIGVILMLTGLQSKLMRLMNKPPLVYTKQLKIPFIGTAEISSVSGAEIVLKLKKQRK